MLTRLSIISELADELRGFGDSLIDRWQLVDEWFQWRVCQPSFRARLRRHLGELSADHAKQVTARSRETTTHFAWCLLDDPTDPFSFWLNEYKPQRDWLRGYADSVHNHRYHFCTLMLAGSYLHERFAVTLDPAESAITSARLLRRGVNETGSTDTLISTDFHRVPRAVDGTLTFLVKSKPVRGWSLSYDPISHTSRKHVPVESRLGELTTKV
ncbi:hypothetical protein EV191_101875 [Tamaricihabitans halophyticus]|uniref:Uncharacterized protein n=1 Tax=Tamaricihabitans halophyticus TaxID=1262583 RepID=A0A4V2SV58_9PSEU|nr:hypothetical protein [Tamaricihabitans halophyticus]TCP56926.1 hypothetical protein EV191_101875 [Tamaricihabitans halophyticus]